MGRLSRLTGGLRTPKALLRKQFGRLVFIVTTLILATVIYAKTSSIPVPSEAELKEYLQSNSLQVGSEVVNDFQHVYYEFGRVRVPITEGESNNTGVVTSGPLIAWVRTSYGDNQRLVYLYDVLSRTTKQLTFYGNASKLVMDGNLLVWEQNTGKSARVHYYDGQQIKVVDSKYTSVRPQVKQGVIAYTEFLGGKSYQVVRFNAETGESDVVKKGDTTNTWPRFEGDQLIIGGPF